MKITIEKRLETLEDLRLAKATLRKKARKQEQILRQRTEILYQGVSSKRIYEEVVESFDLNSLTMQLLPYALKYKDQLLNNPVVSSIAKIKKQHLPYAVGGMAVLSALVYGYFSKDNNPQD